MALDELWKVAKGDIKYADFMQQQQPQRQDGAPPSTQEQLPALPEDLVSFSVAPLSWNARHGADGRHSPVQSGSTQELDSQALHAWCTKFAVLRQLGDVWCQMIS